MMSTSQRESFSLLELSFWPVSFAAVLLVAVALLAPKGHQLAIDQQTYYKNQVALIELEAQGQQFETLEQAMASDPKFRQQVAAVVFGQKQKASENAQTLSLPAELMLDPRLIGKPKSTVSAPELDPMVLKLLGLLRPWSQEPTLRGLTLITAALLLVLSFTVLRRPHPVVLGESVDGQETKPSGSWWSQLAARYRREHD